jgi:hypothetical protein
MKFKRATGDRLESSASTRLRQKLPKFEISKYDMDAYIELFKRFPYSKDRNKMHGQYA